MASCNTSQHALSIPTIRAIFVCSFLRFCSRDIYVSAVFVTATWLAGCLSVTRQYCIKTAKPVFKLFQPTGSFLTHGVDIQFQGSPFSGGAKYTGWEKLAIFDGKRRLSRKRYDKGRWLLWNVNRKSRVTNRMVSFSVTLNDP